MRNNFAIDLFCGLGGWSHGFLRAGYTVVGFDIERHQYAIPIDELIDESGTKGTKPVEKRGWTQGCAVSLGMEGPNKSVRLKSECYPGQLVLQDVRTIHGSQFRDAAIIVASPPCQEVSYMAMPWKRAKQIRSALRREGFAGLETGFPEGYTGSRTRAELTALFDACFRIQREACEAAGRFIPLIVENVRGAQEWFGPAKAHYGSYYLWGDVAQCGNRIFATDEKGRPTGEPLIVPRTVPAKRAMDDLKYGQRKLQHAHLPVGDGPAGRKNFGFRFDGSGRSFQSESVDRHVKVASDEGRRTDPGNGARFTSRDCGAEAKSARESGGWFNGYKRDGGPCVGISRTGSKSNARKAASAMIAKIPAPLSEWAARNRVLSSRT